MVNERYRIAMAETLHYLKGISQEDIKKIPNKFMEFLKLNSSKDYNCSFDYSNPLNELELKDETRGLIAMICLNYWCETEEQKNNFIKHLNQNEIRYQEELRKKYDIDNIFKNNETISNDGIAKEDKEDIDAKNLPIQIEQENIIRRIINKIMNFFHMRSK